MARPHDPGLLAWRTDGGERLVATTARLVFAVTALVGLGLGIPGVLAADAAASAFEARVERSPGTVLAGDATGEQDVVLVRWTRGDGATEEAWLPVESMQRYEPDQQVEVIEDPEAPGDPQLAGECGCEAIPVWTIPAAVVALAFGAVVLGRSALTARRADELIDGDGPTRRAVARWASPEIPVLVLLDDRAEARLGSLLVSPLARSVLDDGSLVTVHGALAPGADVGVSAPGVRVRARGGLGPPELRHLGSLRSFRRRGGAFEPAALDPRPDGSTLRRRLAVAAVGMGWTAAPAALALGGVIGLHGPWQVVSTVVGFGALALVVLSSQVVQLDDAVLRHRRTRQARRDPGAPAPAPELPVGVDPSVTWEPQAFRVVPPPATPDPGLGVPVLTSEGWWLGSRVTATLAVPILVVFAIAAPPLGAFALLAAAWDWVHRVRERTAAYRRPALRWWVGTSVAIVAASAWLVAGSEEPDVQGWMRVGGGPLFLPLSLLAWRILRAGVEVGRDEVVVRDVLRTRRVPASEVVGFATPERTGRVGPAGLVILRRVDDPVRSGRFAVSRRAARRAVRDQAGSWPRDGAEVGPALAVVGPVS